MKEEKNDNLKSGEAPGRATRARAVALSATGELLPLKEGAQENHKHSIGVNSERKVSDTTRLKKREALQDVTNIRQAKKRKVTKPDQLDVSTSVSLEQPQFQTDTKDESLEEQERRSEPEEEMCSDNFVEENEPLKLIGSDSELANTSKDADVPNIDADIEDIRLCSLYAADIYDNMRIAELSRRPHPNYMEKVQRDISPTMRGMLIDWLVEVSEEFNLHVNTLYLSVYLIDWFLSENYIVRQRLQLLGVTCMLIASKYEDINGPTIEKFCFITDNTYTKVEVRQMEIQVLKSCNYQMFAPTTKSFLGRFLRAAQATYQRPSIELEYLAKYLAELTLMNYGFLNFVPSIIAASSVFLARWTLDQSSHPWNPTLEHYTSYKASDLKDIVLALQDLQLNSKDWPLTTIRTKYTEEKFKSIALLSSPKLLEIETLF